MLTNNTYVVSRESLQPMLQATFTNCIVPNRIYSICGLIFYPTIGYLIKIPPIALSSIFCVGMHSTAIRNGYCALKEEVLEGRIVNDEYENKKILDLINDNRISRVHYDVKGNLIFNNGDSIFNSYKGISITKNHHSASPKNRIRSYSNKLIYVILPREEDFLLGNRISYFHLSDEAQTQVDKITKARQNRFRGGMSQLCSAIFFGMCFDYFHKVTVDHIRKVQAPPKIIHICGLKLCVDLQKLKPKMPRSLISIRCVFALLLHCLTSPIYGVNEKTKNFGHYLKGNDLANIIRKEKHETYEKKIYVSSEASKIYIDMFGNIVFKNPSTTVIHRKTLLWDLKIRYHKQ
ncbi:MAG: hypothetical protein H0U27_13035 [Nitrosopumilus sp.]|nr:hypothetical protein [Nitrosopumilus sp.]